MRTLTTRLSGFFRKFSTVGSGRGAPGGGGGDESGALVTGDTLDVCVTCHKPVKKNSGGVGGGGLVNINEKGAVKPSNRVDEENGGENVEEDFTSNVLVGDLGNLASILKKPSRQISFEDAANNNNGEENSSEREFFVVFIA